MSFSAVWRDERFHEVPVEIFQCVTGRLSQSTGASSQLGPNKGQPEVANHSHSWAQPCGRGARMVLKIVFYVFFYHCGKLFNCERGHINRNVSGSHFGLRNSKSPRVALGATAASILPSSLSLRN